MQKGYIYIMVNPSMPGTVKIGKTSRNPDERAKELSNSTNIPFPFEVGYSKLVSDYNLAEKLIHKKLDKNRVANNREFFSISLREAINIINKIILDRKISLNEPEIWDYSFQDNKYSDFKELVKAFTDGRNSMHKAFIHIKEGYVEKWLENIRNYDHLITIQELKEQYKDEIDLILINLLYSINKDIPFKLFGFEINTINLTSLFNKNFSTLNDSEDDIYKSFESGKLSDYYKIYKKHRNYNNKNLDQIFNLKSQGFSKKDINKVLDWYQNPNNYYLSSNIVTLNNRMILCIPSKNEVKNYIDRYYMPHELLKKLKATNKTDVYEAWKILNNTCSFNGKEYDDGISWYLIKKNISYQISNNILNSASKWSISFYLKRSHEILKKNEFSKLTSPLIIPPKLLSGIMSDNIEVYNFCLNLIKYGSNKIHYISKDDYNIQQIEKHLNNFKNSANEQIQEIIKEFYNYKKLFDEHLIFINRNKERLQDYLNYNGLFPIWKHGYLSEDDEKLYKSDPFLQIIRDPVPYFILKERLNYTLSIINQFILPDKFDISFFEDDDLNMFYWFLSESNKDKLIYKSNVENLIIPKELKKLLQKGIIEYNKYISLSEVFPIIIDKDSIKNLLIPDFINKIFQSEDVLYFKKNIGDFKILKDENLFLFKNNIKELCKTFFFPENFEIELKQLNFRNYIVIIKYLKKAGILNFFSYHHIYQEYIKRKKEYNEYEKEKPRFGNEHSPDVSICYDNKIYSFSCVGGLAVSLKDRDEKDLYDKLRHLNWYHYNSISGNTCATVKTRYALQNLESWLLLSNPLSDRKLLIDKKDVDKYRDKWNSKELSLLFNTFNKAIHYHILVQFLLRNVNISKLIELNRNIDIIKNTKPEIYIFIVEKLENYFYKLSDYNYNPILETNKVYRKFNTTDFKLINSITDILNKRQKFINRLLKKRIARKLLKILNSYKSKVVELQ